MRANEETVLVGTKVLLVPYRKEHVEQYNTWMQSPTLQEQTASEPLSLKEEYEMQQSWSLDDDKLTFIILALPHGVSSNTNASSTRTTPEIIPQCKMIGDVNVFLSDLEEDDDDDDQGDNGNGNGNNGTAKRGELEIMIAEPSYRRKGHATESLQLLLWYITSTATAPLPLEPRNLFLKISLANQPSIAMFKKIGFREVKVSEVFQEVELRLDASHTQVGVKPNHIFQWKR